MSGHLSFPQEHYSQWNKQVCVKTVVMGHLSSKDAFSHILTSFTGCTIFRKNKGLGWFIVCVTVDTLILIMTF